MSSQLAPQAAIGAAPELDELGSQGHTRVSEIFKDRVNLVLGLSLLLVLLTSDKSPFLFGLGVVACGVCAWRPHWVRTPWFWLTIAVCQAVRNAMVWTTLDDHIYVANYWSLALALAWTTANPRAVFAHNARWLIALIFIFATCWKATSPDYRSGAFFEYTLLLDDRFLPLAEHVGGASQELLAENYRQMAAVRDPASRATGFTLQSTPRLHLLAHVLTWWTLTIEGAIAVCFLLARTGVFRCLRNTLLILFAITTYLPAPVTGFCAALMTLGIAQTADGERKALSGYLVVLALIVLWTPIWRALVYIG